MTRFMDYSRARFRLVTLVIAAVALVGVAVSAQTLPAHAHAEVVVTSPVENTQVAPPSQISVGMSEGVVVEYSSITLADASGTAVSTGAPTVDATGTSLSVSVPGRLPPGMYTATWHVLSVDGHETDGAFSFEVVDNMSDGAAGPPVPSTDAVTTATPEATLTPEPRMDIMTTDAQSTDSGTTGIIVAGWSALGAGVLAGIAWIIVVFVKRRRVG